MSTLLSWHNKQKPESPPPLSMRLSEIFAPKSGTEGIALPQSPQLSNFPTSNLLIYADNLPTLAHLVENGYRGKVRLIYIDPPYQSGVKWQRKVRLRGPKAITMQATSDHVIGEQAQYDDRWYEAEYLQFIYERLPLLRELLAEDGSLWLHCDHRQAHHLRCLLEEVMGAENFLNTITWRSQAARGAKVNAFYFPASSHSIHIFAKNRLAPTVWNPPKRQIVLNEEEASKQFLRDSGGFFRTSDPGSYSFDRLKQFYQEGRLYAAYGGEVVIDEASQRIYGSKGGNLGVKYYLSKVGRRKWQVERTVDNLWDDIPGLGTNPREDLNYPTQKTEALLTRIIETGSNPGDLVLDCFVGSGTTVSVAHKLERRWIAVDQNPGALTTTRRRLQAQQAAFAIFVAETQTRQNSDVSTGEQKKRRGRKRKIQALQDSQSQFTSLSPIVTLSITRNVLDPATIDLCIENYVAPALEVQLASSSRIRLPEAWRSLIDSVEIDPNFDGCVFCCTIADVPIKKTIQVQGRYTIRPPTNASQIALRITDVLGVETILVRKIEPSPED